ncbi:MAG: hypothetical protein HOP29_03655 [Phycisphaerales bacterium]|nr:hypothetical protein [Phycisphaerales bacterium]
MSLIDAIATLVVLAAVTVPIATGVASLSRGSMQNYRAMSVRCELVRQAEGLRAAAFDDINVGATTVPISLPGGSADLTTTVSLADYDADAAVDASFKLIVIALEDREIRFYRSDWKE